MNYKHLFIQPGDTFKSNIETRHFHKNETYEISYVFSISGGLIGMIKDKNGRDMPFTPSHFDETTKTHKAMLARHRKARLDFFWDNNGISMCFNSGFHYNFETTEFFDLENKAHFLNPKVPGQIATICRRTQTMHKDGQWRHKTIEGSDAYLTSKEDFYKYFDQYDDEMYGKTSFSNVKLNGLHTSGQDAIDYMYYIKDNAFPTFDPKNPELNTPELFILDDIKHMWYTEKDWTFEEFTTLMAEVIFDEPQLSTDNKMIMHDIMEAFELLPKSYGCTAVVKMLRGKAKKKNSTVEHLDGKYPNLKQPMLFTLTDLVESFMYRNKVFVTKEEYGSGKGDEWRGTFEFIGSKAIDTEKLKKYKQLLS